MATTTMLATANCSSTDRVMEVASWLTAFPMMAGLAREKTEEPMTHRPPRNSDNL